MPLQTPFGTTASTETPFDTDGRCGCGATADLDGVVCEDCFEIRWHFDPMVELLDAIDTAPTPTIPLAA